MKRTEFEIATRNGGRETRKGYVIGDFAAHKLASDGYFWKFTHVPTGVSINAYPVHKSKASALAHLEKLALGEALKDFEKTVLADGQWGLGF